MGAVISHDFMPQFSTKKALFGAWCPKTQHPNWLPFSCKKKRGCPSFSETFAGYGITLHLPSSEQPSPPGPKWCVCVPPLLFRKIFYFLQCNCIDLLKSCLGFLNSQVFIHKTDKGLPAFWDLWAHLEFCDNAIGASHKGTAGDTTRNGCYILKRAEKETGMQNGVDMYPPTPVSHDWGKETFISHHHTCSLIEMLTASLWNRMENE